MRQPQYSRSRPGPRYLELLELYRRMHDEGYVARDAGGEEAVAAEDAFPGAELPKFVAPIWRLVKRHQARTILDYGAGKGRQYAPRQVETSDGRSFPDIQAFWGVERIACYDPAVPEFQSPPEGPFDGVISTDTLEHCDVADVTWIVQEMFALARKFVLCNVACYPARARLPGGENAHVTLRHPQWWSGLFHAVAHDHPGVDYALCCVAPAVEGENASLAPTWASRDGRGEPR